MGWFFAAESAEDAEFFKKGITRFVIYSLFPRSPFYMNLHSMLHYEYNAVEQASLPAVK